MEGKIYMKQGKIKLGESSTVKVVPTEDYYQVVDVDEGHVEMRLLDFTGQPFGGAIVLHKDKLKEYTYCPDFFEGRRN